MDSFGFDILEVCSGNVCLRDDGGEGSALCGRAVTGPGVDLFLEDDAQSREECDGIGVGEVVDLLEGGLGPEFFWLESVGGVE